MDTLKNTPAAQARQGAPAAGAELQTWYSTKFLPWKKEAQAYQQAYAEQAARVKAHLPQLEAMVGMLLDGRTRAAVLAWNALGLQPALQDVRLGEGAEMLTLVPVSGSPRTVKVADMLADLERMAKD